MRRTSQPPRPRERAPQAPASREVPAHVRFRLSKRTGDAIEAALRGLTKAQQERVLAAIDRVGEDAGEKVGQWVERNVIGNVNELLAFLTPKLAREGRWNDLRAIWAFLARLDVPVDHRRLVTALGKEAGPDLADRYREEAGLRQSSSARKRSGA